MGQIRGVQVDCVEGRNIAEERSCTIQSGRHGDNVLGCRTKHLMFSHRLPIMRLMGEASCGYRYVGYCVHFSRF